MRTRRFESIVGMASDNQVSITGEAFGTEVHEHLEVPSSAHFLNSFISSLDPSDC